VAKPAREPFNVLVSPPVQRQVEALAGRKAGYQNVRRLLGVDPCHADLKAYRLSGPLTQIVCGLHLKRGYRLAFTTQPPLVPSEDPRTQVVVLYIGKREPGHRADTDVWDVLHDLFDVENPPVGHDKSPCCQGSLPAVDPEVLSTFLKALRRVQRGR
jgi:hypothetical protein